MRAGVERTPMPTEPEHKSTLILAKIINLRKGDTYHSVGMDKKPFTFMGNRIKLKHYMYANFCKPVEHQQVSGSFKPDLQ